MNKQMKHLLSLALDKAVPETWTRLDMDQLDRLCDEFSKLIVEECAKLADNTPSEYLMQPYKYPSTFIKEHFGVGE